MTPIIKSILGLFAVAFIGWIAYIYGTQVSQKQVANEAPTTSKAASQEEPVVSESKLYGHTARFTYSPRCFSGTVQQGAGNGDELFELKADCDIIAQQPIDVTTIAELVPEKREVTAKTDSSTFSLQLVFSRNESRLDIPALTVDALSTIPSSINGGTVFNWNDQADGFYLDVSYFDDTHIFATRNPIFEGAEANFELVNDSWKEVSPFEWLKPVFPDKFQPPFRLSAVDGYLVVTEQNYCCDIVHNPDDPERVAFRMQYWLDPNTKEIKLTKKIPREAR